MLTHYCLDFTPANVKNVSEILMISLVMQDWQIVLVRLVVSLYKVLQ